MNLRVGCYLQLNHEAYILLVFLTAIFRLIVVTGRSLFEDLGKQARKCVCHHHLIDYGQKEPRRTV